MPGRLSFLISCLVLCGCSKNTPEGSAEVAEVSAPDTIPFEERANLARTAPPPERKTREEFFAEIYIPAYEKVGLKDAKWDKEARAYLSLLSTNAGHGISDPDKVRELRDAVDKTGCEDPLVRYMILRQRYDAHVANSTVTNLWVQAAEGLEKSDYHPYWKFFARYRAALAMRAVVRETKTKTQSQEIQEMFNQCYQRSMALLQDHSLPTEVMYQIVDEYYLSDIKRKDYAKWVIENIEPLMVSGWGDTAPVWYAIGEFHIAHAWNERGTGWSDSVSQDGWKAMAEHLHAARVALEKSWSIKPLEKAGVAMLTVELGDSKNRQAMETWFNRVMWMNPASYDACERKMYWLQPKWHGSVAEMIGFGRECLTNTAWRGNVPLILYQSHRLLATWYEQSKQGKMQDYWLLPNVWPDVKASFERYFEVNPLNTGWRHDYAKAAYDCRAWEDLRLQIPLLGQINYEFFGGKEAYEKMLLDAEKNR